MAFLGFVYGLLLGNCGYQTDRKIYDQSETAVRLRSSIRALRARHIYKLAPRELCMEQTSFITSKCETQSSKKKIRSESKCRIPHALHKVRKKRARKTSVVLELTLCLVTRH